SMCFLQPQVHAYCVQIEAEIGWSQDTMQQTSGFLLSHGHIDIIVGGNRELGKYGVAVMPVRINGVASISEFRPDGIGKKFILTGGRPFGQTACMTVMSAEHLLQEDDIGLRGPNGFAELMKD